MNKFDYDELAKNEKTVHIHRRGMMSLVSCVISNNNSQMQVQQSSRCVWPLSSRNNTNILSKRVYSKGL